MIKVLVFDLGGVLIDWDPRYLYRKIFEEAEEMEWFLNNICTPEWNAEQDAGRTFEEATVALIRAYPAWEDAIRAYYDRWPEMLNGPIEGTVDILDELHQSGLYPLYALTNWSAESFPYAQAQYPFLQIFRDILVSGLVRLRKPQPEIYQMLIEQNGLDPGTSLFIDDSPDNIEAARKLGFQTIHFTSPEQCRHACIAYGVRGLRKTGGAD